MIYEVIATDQTNADLRGIYEYIPNKDTGIVTAIRVMYEGRNVENQLNSHTVI